MPAPAPVSTKPISRTNNPRDPRSTKTKPKIAHPSQRPVHNNGNPAKENRRPATTATKNVPVSRGKRVVITTSDEEASTVSLPPRTARSAALPASRHPHRPVSPPVTSDIENIDDPMEDEAAVEDERVNSSVTRDEEENTDEGDDSGSAEVGRKRKRSKGKREKAKKRKNISDFETDSEKYICFHCLARIYLPSP